MFWKELCVWNGHHRDHLVHLKSHRHKRGFVVWSYMWSVSTYVSIDILNTHLDFRNYQHNFCFALEMSYFCSSFLKAIKTVSGIHSITSHWLDCTYTICSVHLEIRFEKEIGALSPFGSSLTALAHTESSKICVFQLIKLTAEISLWY